MCQVQWGTNIVFDMCAYNVYTLHMTTINIRIDEDIKNKATITLNKLGLDMSSAIKMFLTQVIHQKEIPFVSSVNSKKIRERWDREAADALKYGKRYTSGKDLINDILK